MHHLHALATPSMLRIHAIFALPCRTCIASSTGTFSLSCCDHKSLLRRTRMIRLASRRLTAINKAEAGTDSSAGWFSLLEVPFAGLVADVGRMRKIVVVLLATAESSQAVDAVNRHSRMRLAKMICSKGASCSIACRHMPYVGTSILLHQALYVPHPRKVGCMWCI